MWIKDLWNRVLAKFKKEDSISEPVMELKTEEAPEPVPERKTSDEMIITMAESALQDRNETYDGPEPSADRSQSAADTDARKYRSCDVYFELGSRYGSGRC